MTTRMPKHVQDALIANGTMTADHLTRTPRRRHCPTCHAPTLAAIDDLGLDAWTDPNPITPLGELQASTQGRRTWAHDKGALDARDAPFITRFPASELDIHAEHRCYIRPVDTRPPPARPATSADHTNPPGGTDEIPF